MILTITDAGKQREADAMANGTPLPQLSNFLVGAGPVVTPESAATALADQWLSVPIVISERPSPGALQLTALIPAEAVGRIREVGVAMSDGTLYAYAPYQAANDGLYVAAGIAVTFTVVITREDLDDITVDYEAFDVSELSAAVATNARLAIEADLEAHWIAIARNFSNITSETMKIIDQAHEDAGRYV